MGTSLEVEREGGTMFPLDVLEDREINPLGNGEGPPTPGWREKKNTTVVARGPVLRRIAVKPTTVKIKILGKFIDNSFSSSCKIPIPKKRVELNPKISATLNDTELSDVKLVCEGETFLCNKYVLSVGTPVFRRMFVSDTKENQEGLVDIVDVSKDVFRLMLAWIYGEDIAPKLELAPHQQLIELYKVADRYLMEDLKGSLVVEILLSLAAETAFDIYVLGDTCNEERFKDRATHVMKRECNRVFSDDAVFDECNKRYPKLIQEILKTK